MKVDIHITEATAEEVATVFSSWMVKPAGKMIPDNIAVNRVPVVRTPDPQPGQTGCEDCTSPGYEKCEKCSPPPAPTAPIAAALKEKFNPPASEEKKKPAKPKTGNPYGIPKHLFSEDKAKYQRLWSICKKRGITYEEALKVPKRKSPSTSKPSAQAIAPSNEVKEPPQETVPYPGKDKLRELTKAQNGTLQIGHKVKHNGSKASPHFGQVGEITGINKEELCVKFPTGTARLPSYLVLAMPEATT